jgi:hypothetical protein
MGADDGNRHRCDLLFGYSLRSKARAKLLVVLPIVISIAFILVADIDTPRHGIGRVSPQNLISLADVYVHNSQRGAVRGTARRAARFHL